MAPAGLSRLPPSALWAESQATLQDRREQGGQGAPVRKPGTGSWNDRVWGKDRLLALMGNEQLQNEASMDSMATDLTNWPGETPRDKAEGTPKNLQADRGLMGSLAHYRLRERYIWVNIIATEERSRGLQSRNTRSQETTESSCHPLRGQAECHRKRPRE